MFWLALIGVITFIFWSRSKRTVAAEQAYRHSLHRLRHDPRNQDLRQQALGLGRQYANLLRGSNGHALFDEVALMTDINAACAGAMGQEQSTHPTDSVELRLEKLQSLRQYGLIDEAEYAQRRKEILGAI
ncbi:SHOCT domain-containing protein [Pseudomonas sp. DSP3-2-2]|uniref:SHOCT domain-containing protein n=1 Tax=unclassified Pseudomonas TaxID=196821 RepID=UPI003CEA04BE